MSWFGGLPTTTQMGTVGNQKSVSNQVIKMVGLVKMYLELGGGCIIWDDDPYMKMADLNAELVL